MKSLEGLYLTSFDAKKIRIHKKVQEFYQLLKEQLSTVVVPVAQPISTQEQVVATIVTAMPTIEIPASDTQVLVEIVRMPENE